MNMIGHASRFLVATLVASVMIASSAQTAANADQKAVDDLILSTEVMPAGWSEVQQVVADAGVLERFESLYGVPAEAVVNQIFLADGETIQINYCLFSNAEDAQVGMAKLTSFSRHNNPVFQNGNVVVEIISEGNWLKQQALVELDLAGLKNAIIGSESVPSTWQLSQIALVGNLEIPLFENRLGGKIRNIFNQVFSVNGQQLRINYIASSSESDSEHVFQSLEAAGSGEKRLVIKKGIVVIEILGEDPTLVSEAAAVFG